MRAITIDHAAPGHFAIREVDEPQGSRNEALVGTRVVGLLRAVRR